MKKHHEIPKCPAKNGVGERLKNCSICEKIVELAYRCKYKENQKDWDFVCRPCWPKGSFFFRKYWFIPHEAEEILKGSLDLILSPWPSVKSQIMCGKVWLRCKGKTLLGVVNKFLKTNSLSTSGYLIKSFLL